MAHSVLRRQHPAHRGELGAGDDQGPQLRRRFRRGSGGARHLHRTQRSAGRSAALRHRGTGLRQPGRPALRGGQPGFHPRAPARRDFRRQGSGAGRGHVRDRTIAGQLPRFPARRERQRLGQGLGRIPRGRGSRADPRHAGRGAVYLDPLRMAVRRRRPVRAVPRRIADAGDVRAVPARIQPANHRRDPCDHRLFAERYDRRLRPHPRKPEEVSQDAAAGVARSVRQ